jgi:hypothetical protein
MAVNQKTLRGILAQITSVDQKFVVPKQGNFFNPQEEKDSPDTWCAYMIRSNKPRTVPFYNTTDDKKVNGVAVEKIATIDLQFVGPKAEDIALSVSMWPYRSDVASLFAKERGALLNDDMEARSSVFYQDGTNNIIAWNVTIRVAWFDVIDSSQGKMQSLLLDGKVRTRT